MAGSGRRCGSSSAAVSRRFCLEGVYSVIWELALPYLDTRNNDIHTEICLAFAQLLLKEEGGDETIVIPAVTLHDVGWKKVPEEFQLKAFGPKATMPEWNRVHEVEGARIAEEILESIGYNNKKIAEIRHIIENHDSRKFSLSLNESLVKDADKLWRYSTEAVQIGRENYSYTLEQYLNRLESNLDKWFLTASGKAMAEEEMRKRVRESQEQHT